MKTRSKERSKIKTIGVRPHAGVCLFTIISILAPAILSQCGKASSPKFNQYYVQGERLYLSHCSNCHQVDGTGLARVYPPLNTSDYMEKNFEEVICLIRHGKTGEISVNGVGYHQPMKGIPSLSDLEIAEIATYIYNTWNHDRGLVDVKETSAILGRCQVKN